MEKKVWRRIAASLMCLAMIFSVFTSDAQAFFDMPVISTAPRAGSELERAGSAAQYIAYTTSSSAEPTLKVVSRVADGNTMDDYIEKLLNDKDGTRYAGRVWTDKTVLSAPVDSKSGMLALDENTDGIVDTVNYAADFLHVYSALSSTQMVDEYPPKPIDLVLVIDVSSSMLSGDDAASPISLVIQAADSVITRLMQLNSRNRVAVILFDDNPYVLVPLDHYEPANGYYVVTEEDEDGNPKTWTNGFTDKNTGSTNWERLKTDAKDENCAFTEKEYNDKDYEGNSKVKDEDKYVNPVYEQLRKAGKNVYPYSHDKFHSSSGEPYFSYIDTPYNFLSVSGGYPDLKEPEEEAKKNSETAYYGGTDALYTSSSSGADYGCGRTISFTYKAGTSQSGNEDYNKDLKDGNEYKDYKKTVEDQVLIQQDTQSGTNVQGGYWLGLKTLADADTNKVTYMLSSGETVSYERTPAFILLSDGESNQAGDYSTWWIPGVDKIDANGDLSSSGPLTDDSKNTFAHTSTHGYSKEVETHYFNWSGTQTSSSTLRVMKGLMTAAYWKKLVQDNYSEPLQFYTVGLNLYSARSKMNLDPRTYLTSDSSNMSGEDKKTQENIWQLVNEYLKGGNPRYVYSVSADSDYTPDDYTFFHPTNTTTTKNASAYGERVNQGKDDKDGYPDYLHSSDGNRIWDSDSAANYKEEDANYFWRRYTVMSMTPAISIFDIGTDSQNLDTLGKNGAKKFFYGSRWKDNSDKATNDSYPDYRRVTNAAWDTWVAVFQNGANPWLPENSSTDPKNPTKYSKEYFAQYDITDISDLRYNDRYFDAQDSTIVETFNQIFDLIRGSAFAPISGVNEAGVSNAITYQDPIGEYMEIKNAAITTTPHHTNGSADPETTTYDMAISMFGEMHGLVRTGVYDFKWNDEYMATHPTEGSQGYTPIKMGWYKGEPESAEYEATTPEGKTSEQMWAEGWVYRLNYTTMTSYVPIVDPPSDPDDLTEQAKNTVYTIYRFACSDEERNALHMNPAYGDKVPEDIQTKWDSASAEQKQDNSLYSGTPGVYRLSDIRIWVEDTGDYVDTDGAITPDAAGYETSLYVNIPVAALPTQLAHIVMDEAGIQLYETNIDKKTESTPLRLYYAVGLQESLIVRDSDGEQIGVNIGGLSDEYVKAHTVEENGDIWFISNYYSATPYSGYVTDSTGSRTRGDATITFSPSARNRYYVFQKALPLYAHAYRVGADGTLKPVDKSDGKVWTESEVKVGGNGSNTWENSEQPGTWAGGVFMGTYRTADSFKTAYAAANGTITDDHDSKYQKVDNGIVFLESDLLDHVTSTSTGGYADGSIPFNSEDYYFLLADYYVPILSEVGHDPTTDKDVAGSHKGRLEQYVVARRGSEFGSAYQSGNIDNGDMLCWTDMNRNYPSDIEYLSRSDTGDNTRGEPTFEKLSKTQDELRTYLTSCGVKAEILEEQVQYWLEVQQAALAVADDNNNKTIDQNEYNKYFQFAVAARPGGIRTGVMLISRGQKTENTTGTAYNYYIPAVSEESGTGNAIVIDNYMGNNGRLEVGNRKLLLEKRVEAPEGYVLNDNQTDKEYTFTINIDNLSGTLNASTVNYNEFSKEWQKAIGTIDILTDNSGLVMDASDNRVLFERGEALPETDNENNTAYSYKMVVLGDNGTYYYADEAGNATDVQCSTSFDDLYYLYIPGNTGDVDNSTRRIYTYGEELPANSGRTSFYPASETDKYSDTEKTPGMRDNIRAADDEAGRPAGTKTYWVLNAELIPVKEVMEAESTANVVPEPAYAMMALNSATSETGGWRHSGAEVKDLESHAHLRYLNIVIEKPVEGSVETEIISPFKTRTQYNVKQIEFEQVEYPNDNKKVYGKAETTLKDGEGLLFTGLGNDVGFRFTETIEGEPETNGYTLKGVELNTYDSESSGFVKSTVTFDSESEYTVDGNTGHGSTEQNVAGALFTNTFEPDTLTVAKQLDANGYEISAADQEEVFTYDVTFTLPAEFEQPVGNVIDVHYWFGKIDEIKNAPEKAEHAEDEVIANQVITFKVEKEAAAAVPEASAEVLAAADEATAIAVTEYGTVLVPQREISDPSAETDKASFFTVTDDNKLTFNLKADEAVVFYDLPVGTAYTVTEHRYEKYPIKEEAENTSEDKSTDEFYTRTGAVIRATADETHTDVENGKRELFVNVVRQPVAVNLVKELTVNDKTEDESAPFTLDKDMFTFTVTPDASNPSPDPIEMLEGWDPENRILTVTNEQGIKNEEKSQGGITVYESTVKLFSDVKFTEAGTYKYTIKEEPGENRIPGVKYDETEYTVTFEIAVGDGNKLTLKKYIDGTEITDDAQNVVKFENTYNISDVKVSLKAKKVLNGAELSDGQFTFTLTAGEADYEEREEPGAVSPMPDGSVDGITSVTNIGEFATFGEITYTEPGTYKYTLVETPAPQEDEYVEYDTAVYDVTVTVTRGDDGELTSTVEYKLQDSTESSNDAAVFTNTVYGDLKLTKEVSENTEPGTFTFEITLTPPESAKWEDEYVAVTDLVDSDDNAVTVRLTKNEKGQYTGEFTLESGKSMTFVKLPAGTEYVITEKNADKYNTTVNSEDGKTASGTIEKGLTASNTFEFVNTVPDFTPEKREETPGAGEITAVGEEISYKISFSNPYKDGAVITVTDPLDEGVDFVSAGIGELGITVEKPNAEGSVTINEAEVPATVKYDAATRTVTWVLGNETDKVPAGYSGEVALTVKVNETAVKTWSYETVEGAPEKDYKVINRAEVKINDNSKYTGVVENPVPEKTEETPGDGEIVGVGENITYNIHWENGHSEEATVTIEDPLDEGVEFVSASYGDYTYNADGKTEGTKPENVEITYNIESHTVTWTIRAGAQESGDVRLTVKVTEKAVEDTENNVVNRAKVTVGDHSAYTSEVENPVPEKTETNHEAGETVKVGDELVYEISFRNGKSEPAIVTVTDTLDNGVDFVKASFEGIEITAEKPNAQSSVAINGAEISVTVKYDATTRMVTWVLGDETVKVPAGYDGKVSLTVKVNNNAVPVGTVNNEAAVEVGNKSAVTNKVENPVTGEPDVTLEKYQSVNGGELTKNLTEVNPGDTVTYYLDVKNTGDTAAKNVTVKDTVPEGLTYVEGSAKIETEAVEGTVTEPGADNTILWTINELAPDAEVRLSFKVTVPAVSENTTWTNVGYVKYDDKPKDPENPDDPWEPSNKVEVEEKVGSIYLTKTVENYEQPAEGESLVFGFRIALYHDEALTEPAVEVSGTYGGVAYNAGVGEFSFEFTGELGTTVKHLDGIPVGLWYKIEETDSGEYVSEFTIGSATGQITDSSTPVAITVTNRVPKPATADLTVKKSVVTLDGSDVDTEAAFSFTVEFTDPDGEKITTVQAIVNGVETTLTADGDEFSFTLKATEQIVFKDLPVGTSYVLTEAPCDGYLSSLKDPIIGTISADIENAVTVVNTKQLPKTADLTVEKSVITLDGSDADIEAAFSFTAEFTDPDGEKITTVKAIVNGVETTLTADGDKFSFTLKATERIVFKDLPVGTSYVITEASAEGYTNNLTEGIASGVISEDTENKVAVVNTKELPATGSLTLTKTVAGAQPDGTEFSFTIELFDGVSKEHLAGTYSYTGSKTGVIENGYANITLTGGQSITISGLPVGTEFRIAEAPADGYEPSANLNGAPYVIIEGAVSGNITAEGAAVEYVNTKTEPEDELGNLTVKKTVQTGDQARAWNFTVTLSDTSINGTYGEMTFVNGVAGFTLVSGQSITATGLPAGVGYTVTETDANADGYVTSYIGQTGVIAAGQTAYAEVINNFEETPPPPEDELGNLTVRKTVQTGDQTRAWNFTVILSDTSINGTYGEMTFVNGVAGFTLVSGQSITATGLPAGVGYTVTETDANADGYVTSYIGQTGVILADQTAYAEVINNLEETPPPPPPAEEFGALTVAKTVQSDFDEDYMRTFSFVVQLSDPTVNGQYGGMFFTNGTAYITLSNGQSVTAIGLPAGITYSVYEIDGGEFTVLVNGVPIGMAGGIIPANGTAFAAFTNIRNDEPGDEPGPDPEPEPEPEPEDKFGGLTVTKSVTTSSGELSDEDMMREFIFTVYLSDPTINGWYGDMYFVDGVATFTLRNGEAKSASGLPEGTGYSVSESANDGYEVSSTGESGIIPADSGVMASFVNKRSEQLGGLTVRKFVTGAGLDYQDFTFTVTLSDPTVNGQYGGMFFVNGVAVFTLKHGESVTATGLPAEIGYSVGESGNEFYVVTATGETGVIVDGTTVTAEYINYLAEEDLQSLLDLLDGLTPTTDFNPPTGIGLVSNISIVLASVVAFITKKRRDR